MFEPIEEWDPLRASELASIGAWDIPDVPGEPVATPAGLDELVHEAQLTPLGPATLPLLLATPPALLSDQGRSIGLNLLTKLSRTVDALRAEFTAAIAGPSPASRRDAQDDFSPQEVAVATISSIYSADRQIWLARDLAGRLKATAQAMRLGDISLVQATALSEATGQLGDDIARSIEAKVLQFSYRQDARLFKASLRRWVAKLDPDFSVRAKDARAAVDVEHTAHSDGTGQLYIRGPLEVTATINLALTTYATKTKDTLGGTADQRKLTCLRDWAESYLGSPGVPTHHGRPPTVNIVTDLATVLGMRDHPADIPGVGPIPAEAVRWLLADGAPVRRLIIDPTDGHLLDYGQTTYKVPPNLADFLIAQNVRSGSPHSSVPAEGCDMEHNTPHDQGGATDRVNTTPVERRWHRAKTHGHWTYLKCRDGTLIWTSPTGLTVQVDPYDYRCGP